MGALSTYGHRFRDGPSKGGKVKSGGQDVSIRETIWLQHGVAVPVHQWGQWGEIFQFQQGPARSGSLTGRSANHEDCPQTGTVTVTLKGEGAIKDMTLLMPGVFSRVPVSGIPFDLGHLSGDLVIVKLPNMEYAASKPLGG